MNMNEGRYDRAPMEGPARRWYVRDGVLLSKLVGIYAILFAILRVIACLMELQGKDAPSWALVSMVLILLTLVLSLGPAIRMTRMALLSALVVVYAIFFVILHVIAYSMGLQRDLSFSSAIVIMVLALLTLALSLGLVLGMMRPWPEGILGLGRRMALCFLTTVGIVVFLVLPFTRVGWPLYKTSTRAFRKCALAHVDLDAMRAWLSTLDGKYNPNDVYELVYATIEDRWPETALWARTITRWRPECVRLARDHNNHPTIRIAGLRGHSLVVGSESMQTPPADFLKRDKYRLSLGPGAYVGRGRW